MFDQKDTPKASGLCPQHLQAPSTITSPANLPESIWSDPVDIQPAAHQFGMRIPTYFLKQIRNADDPLAKQVIPDRRELEDPCSQSDPLAEAAQSPTPVIIHRYPNRVIFLVTNQCAIHCRFCMRKRRVAGRAAINTEAIDAGIAYIRDHPALNEAILSGGDPLMLSDRSLHRLLKSLHTMPHLRVLRIHTRIPCVWPQRITADLAENLASFQPLYINIHVNHPNEITREVAQALATLSDAGIPLGSQTVLLKGVNDDTGTLRALFEKLLTLRVRPYYLHLLDRVPGTAHFQIPLERCLALTQKLRGHLSGLGMPHLMADLPGGGGKVELVPESQLVQADNHLVLKNFQGHTYYWPLS